MADELVLMNAVRPARNSSFNTLE